MSKYRSLNYTELSSINIDNFNIIGVFKLTGATGTLPSDLTFPCIFENYEGFQISRKYDKIYNRQKSGASWSSWKELDLNDKSFLSLSDTPNSYTGFQGKLLRVNPNGTGLEFDNFSYSTYSKMEVGNSFPTSPNHSDLFYNQTNNTLWRYDAISSNWIPIDYMAIDTDLININTYEYNNYILVDLKKGIIKFPSNLPFNIHNTYISFNYSKNIDNISTKEIKKYNVNVSLDDWLNKFLLIEKTINSNGVLEFNINTHNIEYYILLRSTNKNCKILIKYPSTINYIINEFDYSTISISINNQIVQIQNNFTEDIHCVIYQNDYKLFKTYNI